MQKPRDLKRKKQPMPSFVRQALEDYDLVLDYESRPSYQRNDYIAWINNAKQEPTKQKRLAQMLEELELGGVYMKMEHSASRKSGTSASRTVKKTNRDGSAEVNSYLASLPGPIRQVLTDLRQKIKAVIPDCTERIAYGMPVFRLKTDICGMQAHQNFCSLYTMEKNLPAELKIRFPDIEISNSSIRFHPDKPIAKEVIQAVIEARLQRP